MSFEAAKGVGINTQRFRCTFVEDTVNDHCLRVIATINNK